MSRNQPLRQPASAISFRPVGRPRNPVPSLLRHSANDTAYVIINRRQVGLGPWGHPETIQRYTELVQEYLAMGGAERAEAIAPRTVMARISTRSVEDLADAYLKHCEAYYRKRGEATATLHQTKRALDLLSTAGHGRTAIAAFGPRALKDYQRWLAKGVNEKTGRPIWSRSTINVYVVQVVRMFGWGVSEELVEEPVYRALKTVPSLSRGRSPAPGVQLREGSPVQPVEDDAFEATLAELAPTLAAMAQVQALCGMRPAEVCHMRVGDLKPIRTPEGEIGVIAYGVRADWNKTDHHNIVRTVYLGPKATAIVAPRIEGKMATDYVFTPREAMDEVAAAKRAERKTPLWASHSTEARRARRGQKPAAVRDSYDTNSFARAVRRACERANAKRREADLPAFPLWSPNQLRHTAATRYTEDASVEVAMNLLGHSDIKTTMNYVKVRERSAIEAARKLA